MEDHKNEFTPKESEKHSTNTIDNDIQKIEYPKDIEIMNTKNNFCALWQFILYADQYKKSVKDEKDDNYRLIAELMQSIDTFKCNL